MIDHFRQELAQNGHIELRVRIRPHAPQSRLIDVLGDGSMKIDIAAPAEDGKGNTALVRFLAEAFEVSKASVSILSGKTARLKLVRIIRP